MSHVASALCDEWKALCREIFSPPAPIRVPGLLAKLTPEWVFNPNPEHSPDQAWPDQIIGITLNGPRVSPLDYAGFGHATQILADLNQALRAILELRDGMARMEGERQARLRSTRAATEANRTKPEDRRDAILLLCRENGWRLDARGNAGRIKRNLERDRRFRNKDNTPAYLVSRRTVANDLIYLATTSSLPTE
jgi:hypothetical protein